MAEPNPWDKLTSSTCKPEVPRIAKSQASLVSRLKSNILSSKSDLQSLPKVSMNGSSLLSKLSVVLSPNVNGFGSQDGTRSLIPPSSFLSNDSELKENRRFLDATNIVLSSEIIRKDTVRKNPVSEFVIPTRSNSLKVKSSSQITRKTGSFLFAPLRDLTDIDAQLTNIVSISSGSGESSDKVTLGKLPLMESSSFNVLSHESVGEAKSGPDTSALLTSCSTLDSPNSQSHPVAASLSSILTPSVTSVQENISFPSSLSCPGRRNRRATPTGNYLKLNLRKKCFSRGGTRLQARSKIAVRRAKYAAKFDSWRSKKSTKTGKCFRCFQEGHWASKCPKTLYTSKPSAQEIEEMEPDYGHAEWRVADIADLSRQFYNGPQLQDLLNYDRESMVMQVPMSQDNDIFDVKRIYAYMNELVLQMGINSFRPGQERVIWRILAGKSTLLILPTAGGKSLCYQIPAGIFQKLYPSSVALVISPLISLMQDQILSSVSSIRGAYLSSSQTREEKEEILRAVKRGQYAYILMSPEALVETDWILRQNCLPPISFVCVDEAHCLADWSHHFRPSYLQICNLLRTRLGITRFLGLSATCTPSTIRNICHNLGISEAIKLDSECNREDIFSSSEPNGAYLQPISCPIPSNLLVTASLEHNRDEALIKLLQKPPFSEQLSILIYAATRDLTERLAGYIRTSLQDVKENVNGRTMGWNTAVYHAGLTPNERTRVQKRFMAGKIRVLVATSAFGMGLNKQDLQAVIHYSLPKSFENYVQEIGRVGRNGQWSYCHTFLPPGFSSKSKHSNEEAPLIIPEEAREANELRRHIFANHIDTIQLKRLLHLIVERRSLVVALDPNQIAEEIDIKPESLATLITYMHLRTDMQPLVSILPSWPAKVTFSCYGGPLELASVSSRSLVMSAWLGLLKSQSPPSVTFPPPSLREVNIDLPLLCNTWGWKPDSVLRELRSFEWDSTGPSGAPRRTGVTVSLVGASRATWLWVNPIASDSLSERLDAEIVYLRHRLNEVEQAGLRSLAQLQSAIALVAARCIDDIEFSGISAKIKSEQFHALVESHFTETLDEQACLTAWPRPVTEEKELAVRRTVGEFLRLHRETVKGGQVTGRVLANIFHGIGSPNFPAISWSRVYRFWRAHLDVDWPQLQRITTRELITAHAAF